MCWEDVFFYVRFIIIGLPDEGFDRHKYLKNNALNGYDPRKN